MTSPRFPHCTQCGSTLNTWTIRVCHNCEQKERTEP
ncbi:hypothetical protein SAMN04488550_4164 [Gordonia malaquae]|nr:hypothetical protein SAMN04488550_4164 [Gordonia malaquae]